MRTLRQKMSLARDQRRHLSQNRRNQNQRNRNQRNQNQRNQNQRNQNQRNQNQRNRNQRNQNQRNWNQRNWNRRRQNRSSRTTVSIIFRKEMRPAWQSGEINTFQMVMKIFMRLMRPGGKISMIMNGIWQSF